MCISVKKQRHIRKESHRKENKKGVYRNIFQHIAPTSNEDPLFRGYLDIYPRFPSAYQIKLMNNIVISNKKGIFL